jgi:hypothetical protein
MLPVRPILIGGSGTAAAAASAAAGAAGAGAGAGGAAAAAVADMARRVALRAGALRAGGGARVRHRRRHGCMRMQTKLCSHTTRLLLNCSRAGWDLVIL